MQRVRSLLIIGALGAALSALADGAPGPTAILDGRDPVVPVLAPPLASAATTQERWAWLSHSGAFDADYVLSDIVGPDSGTRTVVVIPQVHPSDTLPLAWTSLGALTAHVQFNIDAALTHMEQGLSLSCVGTEGSALARVDTPWALSRWVWRKRDVQSAAAHVQKVLKSEGLEDGGATARLATVLQSAIDAHRFQLDGAGYAQARLDDKRALFRFGLENEALNRQAVRLAQERAEKERALAALLRGAGEVERGEVAAAPWMRMWLDEIDAHQGAVIAPFMAERETLASLQKTLRARGADGAAADVGRFLALAARVDDEAIRSAEIVALTAELRTPAAAVKRTDAGPAAPALTSRELKRRAALEADIASIAARYDATVMRAREEEAVRRTLLHLGDHDGLCAIVMGLNHEAGLLAAMAEQAPDVGVIVLRPFGADL